MELEGHNQRKQTDNGEDARSGLALLGSQSASSRRRRSRFTVAPVQLRYKQLKARADVGRPHASLSSETAVAL
jgi:hypothetical protein